MYTLTPRETSPLNLIQEQLRDEPWRLLVAVIFLNLTSAKQAKPVLDEFFRRWPCPWSAVMADPSEVAEVLKPIGLQNRRAQTIVRMSGQFLVGFDHPDDLHGIGKYGADSYNMFVRGLVLWDVQDKELKNYVNWVRAKKEKDRDRRIPEAKS